MINKPYNQGNPMEDEKDGSISLFK